MHAALGGGSEVGFGFGERQSGEQQRGRVAMRTAGKKGDACPPPPFPGSFLFSFKLKDFLETAWVRGEKGPKSQVEAICSGQQSQGLVGGSLGLLSCGIDARIGEVLKQRHVHVGLPGFQHAAQL